MLSGLGSAEGERKGSTSNGRTVEVGNKRELYNVMDD
ncbi:hypothetical protein, conserved [Leishmania donovani]|nr:hypothetical protein, conserved [Leishmania donovani]CBZ32699.1 hypothetical protein, conserved [Leishmania donovani]